MHAYLSSNNDTACLYLCLAWGKSPRPPGLSRLGNELRGIINIPPGYQKTTSLWTL